MQERFAFARIALANDMVELSVLSQALTSVPPGETADLGDILLQLGAMSADDVALVRKLRRRELTRGHSANDESKGSAGEAVLEEGVRSAERRTLVRSNVTPPKTPAETERAAIPGGAAAAAAAARGGAPGAPGASGASGEAAALQRHKYVLREPIGEGGQGLVRCALDTDIDRLVAVKVLKPELADTTGHARFMREIRTTGKLEHPSIVPIYDMGQTADGLPYYVMRYVRGRTLEEIISRLAMGKDQELARKFPRTRLLQILYQVAMGIQFAHDHQCLHCDLKPANIVIGDYGEAIILDWGLVHERKRPDPQQLGTDSIKVSANSEGFTYGTPQYMSPEQARGQEDLFDTRTDVYSLGAILYEILTYKIAFQGETATDIMVKVIEGRLDPPTQAAPERDIPLELERICMTAMELSRRDRHQSARELAEEILEFLEGSREKERLRLAALEKSEVGRRLRRQHQELHDQTERLQREVTELEELLARGAPGVDREQLWAVEENLDATRTRTVIALGSATNALSEALGLDAGCHTARRGLADIYWERFLEAEAAGDYATAALMKAMVERLNDDRYSGRLQGDGKLAVRCSTPGAQITLFDLVQSGRRLVPRNPRLLGSAPLPPVTIPMGRYFVTVNAPGQLELGIPVRVHRSGSVELDLQMYFPEQIPPGFVLIPRGKFQYQGDRSFRGSLEARILHLPDFCIGRFPVTCSEYREFLDDLARTDLDLALSHAPRPTRDGAPFLQPDSNSRFAPMPGQELAWGDRLPVRYVSWHDAMAYASWRSRKLGFEVTLPTEEEWEKAARGADARIFPWGDRFDSSFCSIASKDSAPISPCSVDDFPMDVSPYGVRGMGGNVQDWCLNAVEDITGMRLLRGGTFRHNELSAQTCRRRGRTAEDIGLDCGFRLRALPLTLD